MVSKQSYFVAIECFLKGHTDETGDELTNITANIENFLLLKPFCLEMFNPGILLLSRIPVPVISVVISMNKPVFLNKFLNNNKKQYNILDRNCFYCKKTQGCGSVLIVFGSDSTIFGQCRSGSTSLQKMQCFVLNKILTRI